MAKEPKQDEKQEPKAQPPVPVVDIEVEQDAMFPQKRRLVLVRADGSRKAIVELK